MKRRLPAAMNRQEDMRMHQTDLNIAHGSLTAATPGFARGSFSPADRFSPARRAAEHRVRSGFSARFGARLASFMPVLARYQHMSGASGVIGIRRASEEPLLLENYLSRPIEAEIAGLVAAPVDRGSIAEIGQFVVDDRSIVGDLFLDLVPFLLGERFDWVCFTGTGQIRALLARVGFHGMVITAADSGRVGNCADQWGSYYDNDPVVIIGRLDDPQGEWMNAPRTAREPAAAA
jgi:hypothetical protein